MFEIKNKELVFAMADVMLMQYFLARNYSCQDKGKNGFP